MIMASLYLTGAMITAISIWCHILSNPSTFSLDPSPSKWDEVDFLAAALFGLVCGCLFPIVVPIVVFVVFCALGDWWNARKTQARLQNQADSQLLSWALSLINVK